MTNVGSDKNELSEKRIVQRPLGEASLRLSKFDVGKLNAL